MVYPAEYIVPKTWDIINQKAIKIYLVHNIVNALSDVSEKALRVWERAVVLGMHHDFKSSNLGKVHERRGIRKQDHTKA